jgi:PPM family protein phosphatase
MQNTDDSDRRRVLASPLTVDEFVPASSAIRVNIGTRSHQGVVRTTNDDHYLVVQLERNQQTLATSLPEGDLPRRFEEHGFAMAVADGIGSGGSGSVASRVALSTVAHLVLHYGKWNLRIDPKIASEVLANAARLYSQVDEAVATRRESAAALVDMATSLTTAYSAGDHLFVAHVGHSRAYLFRDGILTQLTRDHTTARYLSETGKPVAMERRGQDMGHILTDAIGARGRQPEVEVEHFRLVNGDCLLLCTNGLTDMVTDEMIADTLAQRRQPNEQCRLLVDLANQKGGEDNVTVILAQYEVPTD